MTDKHPWADAIARFGALIEEEYRVVSAWILEHFHGDPDARAALNELVSCGADPARLAQLFSKIFLDRTMGDHDEGSPPGRWRSLAKKLRRDAREIKSANHENVPWKGSILGSTGQEPWLNLPDLLVAYAKRIEARIPNAPKGRPARESREYPPLRDYITSATGRGHYAALACLITAFNDWAGQPRTVTAASLKMLNRKR